MSTQLVGLAILMGLVTYPWRALPLLAPGMQRLSPLAQTYLRLVAPATLAALAAANIAVAVDAGGARSLHVGVEWLSLAACVALVAWRRNLFAGLVVAVLIAAGGRAIGA